MRKNYNAAMRKLAQAFAQFPSSFKKTFLLILTLSFSFFAFAQKQGKLEVVQGELVKTIPSLKNFRADPNIVPRVTRDLTGLVMKKKIDKVKIDYGSVAKGDPVVQRESSATVNAPSTIGQNYDGMNFTNVAPADPTLATGNNHVIQMINGQNGSYVKIWDKAGNVALNQTYMYQLFAVPGYDGSGDPIALYDQFADRYFITEFGQTGGVTTFVNTLIVAVSVTNDPTGSWNIYKYVDNSFFVDYPHFGVWPNVLYATSNDFNTAGTAYLGSSVYAFDKTAMIAGNPVAQMQRQRFNNADEVYGSVAPVSISGSTPPAPASPGLFVYYSDDNWTAAPADVDFLQVITFQPDFTTPANTVIALGNIVNTAPFKSGICNFARNCIPSAGGGYDAISDRIMNRIYYRNFGSYEALVLNHTVDANFPALPQKAGVRWYELRRSGGPWSMFQQSTYAPDADSRWMGTIGINSLGDIAIGYNHSGAGKFASIYFAGRRATDPLGTFTTGERLIIQGTGYGTFSNRWGDYNDMATDRTDDVTFWMTAMYGATNWKTRVASFKIGDPCPVITATPATLPNYNYNQPYTTTVTGSGGTAPYTYSISAGSLPPGLSINPTTGQISGTPTGTANSYNFTVQLVDFFGCVGTQAYQLSSNNIFSTVPSTTVCNSSLITIPTLGNATPYPSPITVAGVTGSVAKVTVTLNGINHTWTNDIDILLVGPGGQRAIILSDVGADNTGMVNVTLTLDDDAAQSLPATTPVTSGTFKPTNYGASDPFPGAPGTTANSALSTFNGVNPNGQWNLYVRDDVTGDFGNISGGWCLNFYVAAPPQITCPSNITVNTDPGQCTAGVALTGANAATTSGGNPSATITYSIAGLPITSPYNFPKGTTTVTATASNGVAPDATCTFTVTVNDAEAPVVNTCPPAQAFTVSSGGTYTIPPIVVSDNCPGVSVSYSITGATTRSGTGTDASGAFNLGVSNIAWTVTDAASNLTTTCATTVTVTAPVCNLSVSIPDVSVLPSGVSPNTVYRGYAPAASITLTAQPSGGSAPYTYSWSNGAATQSITVSPIATTTYTVTVSKAGCTSATASKTVNVVDVRCGNKLDKVEICKVPPGNPSNAHTNCVSANAVAAQLSNGSYLGACGTNGLLTRTNKGIETEMNAPVAERLTVQTAPNPSSKHFTLTTRSKNLQPLQISIVNSLGKVVEVRSNVPANGTLQIGAYYKSGSYFAIVTQGSQRVSVKLIKIAQ